MPFPHRKGSRDNDTIFGLIRRRPSDRDRRIKVLQLTPAGLRARDMLVERMSTPPPILDRLSPRERQALVRILSRLLGEQ